MKIWLSVVLALVCAPFPLRAAPLNYQAAPAPLDQLITAPALPAFLLAPDQQHYLLAEVQARPELKDLAGPELRLGGLRFNPDNFAPTRSWAYTGLKLYQTRTGRAMTLRGLPAPARLNHLSWSPNGRQLALIRTMADRNELWVLDVARGQFRLASRLRLNRIYGTPCVWLPDSSGLICREAQAVPAMPPELPQGPVVQENTGQAAPGRTYQDLLKSPRDEERFSAFLSGQLWRIPLQGKAVRLGKPGLITDFQPSPDGRWLLVEQWHPPFSYAFPAFRFPLKTELWNSQGQFQRLVADLPLADQIPLGRDAVRVGRREISWQADQPARLSWVEAADGGDPARNTEIRDRLYDWSAPFSSPPRLRLELPGRFERAFWKDEQLALIYSGWYNTRQRQVWLLRGTEARRIAEFSSEDRYADPGLPLTRPGAAGQPVLQTAPGSQAVFLRGQGASPEGDRPFLDRWDPVTGIKQRLWRAEAPWYEELVSLLDPQRLEFLTRRENPQTPPNYVLHRDGQVQPLTHFQHPLPALAGIRRELIQYTRADGVPLSAMLYLPAGYRREQGPLPTIFWAYPREFKDPAAAGQVKGSPQAYIQVSPASPLVFAALGYAVVDHPDMPIIGVGKQEPNDTYVSQLVASAQAAADKVVAMGVADPQRLAIGGHSYGAFMTANLLIHSRIFKAGIARSGAYNRTLTPFGFQAEERSFWQAPQVYQAMSPLLHADQIGSPLLLIHGQADDNPGTHPLQSENFYQALKGLGKPARLVMLPYESHGYQARESLGHMLWEMSRWLEQHLKH
jgi:dipeptidyl aminopeptidase/acylaminoacyl peptidase